MLTAVFSASLQLQALTSANLGCLGRQIFDRAQYSTGITLHYVSILLFVISTSVIVATQFCAGCSSGLIIVPRALLLAATLSTLHALARHLIRKSRERPRRAV